MGEMGTESWALKDGPAGQVLDRVTFVKVQVQTFLTITTTMDTVSFG
jgi:hypothetical protein